MLQNLLLLQSFVIMATASVRYALHISSPWNGDRSKCFDVKFKRMPKCSEVSKKVDETAVAKKDEELMRGFFVKKGIQNITSLIYNAREHSGKEFVLQYIRQLFEHGDGTHFILSFTGHGLAPRAEKDKDDKDKVITIPLDPDHDVGAWTFEPRDPESEETIRITFRELLAVWDSARNGRGPRFLMIISDSCFAGEWVKQLNDTKRRDICIQAACRADQECEWDPEGSEGSFFIRKFVDSTHTENAVKAMFNKLFFDIPYLIQERKFKFIPMSSRYAPSGFGQIRFFDSFAEM